jgi:hypothetical protein
VFRTISHTNATSRSASRISCVPIFNHWLPKWSSIPATFDRGPAIGRALIKRIFSGNQRGGTGSTTAKSLGRRKMCHLDPEGAVNFGKIMGHGNSVL